MLELIGRIGVGSVVTVYFDRASVSGKYRGLYYNAIVVENGKAVYYIALNKIAAVELPYELKPKLAGRAKGNGRRRPASPPSRTRYVTT